MSQVQTLATFESQDDTGVTVSQFGGTPLVVPKAKIHPDDVAALVGAVMGSTVNIRIDQGFCDEAKLS